ncbi:MAG TPA: AsmA-like C-terminal region-containing protein, partial [Gammaproteobacteria bacterium]|nr:AsmA-like C-terminal region-containing protein [Gammaproteobacteria bacterium]
NLSLTTGGVGNGEPVSFDAALDFADEVSGLRGALAANAVVAAAASGAITATDVETNVTVDAANGAPARTLEATASRIVFDRAAETLAVEGLVTEIAGVRAAWQLEGGTIVTEPTVRGSLQVDPSELATVFEQLGLSLPASLDPADLGTFTLAAQFELQAEPQTVRLSQIDAELLGMHVAGDGALTGRNELAGHVVIAEFTPSATVQTLLRSAVPPTIDVGALGPLALDARFDTNLDTRRGALRDFTLTALGAKVSGTLEGIPGERGNVFRGTLRTSRFSAEPMAKAFAALLPANLAANELGMIELDTRFELDTAADTLSLPQLRAEAFGLRASGEVTARNVARAAVWTGTANVAEFSPQDLLQRFGLPPQPTSDAQAFKRATVATRFTVTKDGAQLDDVELKLDETTIKGTFALQGFDARTYRFALDVDRVDADRYLPPKARDAQAGQQTAGDIQLPQNNTMNLDGTMNIAALKLAGMQFSDVGSRIVIGNGDMKLENARARLYGGSFAGNFHVRAAGNDPGLALDGRASGLQLEPLIAALTADAPNFSGTGSFDLNLAGKGRTIIENVQSAGGNVSFDMVGGAIKGFNLGRTLCSAYNVTQRAPSPPELPAVTAYEAIKGSAVVAAGTATSNDLLARTSFMDINGAGSLQLVEQQLDYELDAKLTAPIEIDNCQTLDEFVGGELPFRIKGTVLEPTITPDFSKLIRRQLREGLQDRLEDRLKDRLRGILR